MRALCHDPTAFGSTYEREVALADAEWERRAGTAAVGDEQFLAVATDEGRFVAMVGAFTPGGRPGERHLYGMWVAPEARSAGLGASLVAAVLEWAAGARATRVSLWVVDTNQTAIDLYQRAGFEMTGESQPLPSDPSVRESRMSLRLG